MTSILEEYGEATGLIKAVGVVVYVEISDLSLLGINNVGEFEVMDGVGEDETETEAEAY